MNKIVKLAYIESQRLNVLLLISFIIVFGFSIVSLVKIITTSAPDFSVFYHSAVNLINRVNLYHDRTLFTGLGYPPVTLLPFLPFTLLPYKIVQGLWVIGSFFMFIAALVVSLKLVNKLDRLTFTSAFALGFLSFPTRFTLGMGQVNFAALFFLLLSIYFSKSSKPLAIIALIIVLIIKPHFGLLLPFFILAGEWLIVLAGLAGYFAFTLLVSLIFDSWQLSTYINSMLPALLTFQGREIYYNQGLSGFFSRLLPLPAAFESAILISIIIFVLSLLITFRQKLNIFQSLILALPTLLLVEPLSWQHHYVFLMPTFIYLWKIFFDSWVKLGILGVSYILISVNIKSPLIWVNVPFGGFILSHVFLGTLLLYILALMTVTTREVKL